MSRAWPSAVIGTGATALVFLVTSGGWLERVELVTWDARQRWLGEEAGRTPIKLILIDQQSLDWANGQAQVSWPWPREFYGKIIEFCRAGGAKGVGLDMFFSEPSMYGADDDERLSRAMKAGGTVVLAVAPGTDAGTGETWPADAARSEFHVAGLEEWTRKHEGAEIEMASVVMSEREIAGAATALGHVAGNQDADSIVRTMTPVMVHGDQVLPVLGLALHQAAEGREAMQHGLHMEGDWLITGGRRIPMTEKGRTILRFRAATKRGEQERMYEAYSAAGIISSQLALEEGSAPAILPTELKDCYVLVGPSAVGTYDLKPTPVNKAGPGVEVQATFLDNLLKGDFMREARGWAVWMTTLVLAVMGAAATRLARNWVQVVTAFGIMLMLPIAAGYAGFKLGWWWPIAGSEAGVSAGLLGGLVLNLATEGRQRRFIKRSFQQYVSPAVIEQILEDPSRLRLGGERRELSIFFSDIAGFSGIAEKLEAEALAELMNQYLTVMTEIVHDERGTLDKYIGDAIVAFWNAPTDQADHAARAVRAAARCQAALRKQAERFGAMAGGAIRTRIGVNTGWVSVGNFGSAGRFDYTMIGHAVNVASRLEGANKVFGTSTLVAEETWRQSQGAVQGREVGLVRVVGVREPVRVYEVGEAWGEARDQPRYEEGLRMCQAGNSAEALAVFESLRHDPLARVYEQKLRAVLKESEGTWNGVWDLKEK